MKIFLDWEFDEDGVEIRPLSGGFVREDGETLYIVVKDADHSRCNDWVKANVLPYLHDEPLVHLRRSEIAAALVEFCGPAPEFWGYYADYDWVCTAQCFGTMLDLPKGWPMFCMDLKQYAVMLGNPQLPPQVGKEHVAINDAMWTMLSYYYLRGIELSRGK